MDGDIRLAVRLLQWANPEIEDKAKIVEKNIIEYNAA